MIKRIQARSVELPEKGYLDQVHPVLKRIYRARNVESEDQLDYSLKRLPQPNLLFGMNHMVQELVAAIENQNHILIVADFDADGATSCAVAMLGFEMMGLGQVSYLVPNRFEYGYGLTPEIVAVARRKNPDVIITVDNGISSLEGVAYARKLGIKVLITDHHLPGETLPEANAIVNPNLPEDTFPSKALAGVGVMFYVLSALRAELRSIGWFADRGVPEPNLAQLLDFVALGTVADVVELDHVNRILVSQGVKRIQSGKGHAGIQAIVEAAGRSCESLTASDLGFVVGPRLNAAGRLEDMSLGIECLLSSDIESGRKIAQRLDSLNHERREIEDRMKLEALDILKTTTMADDAQLPAGICLYDDRWHQGVVGILASRMKDRLNRPVIAFAPADNGILKGSGRSVPGIHIRDILSEVAARNPDLLEKFGGHAMAAGLSIDRSNYDSFSLAFSNLVKEKMGSESHLTVLYTDGELDSKLMMLGFAEQLDAAGPWGHGFPEPIFHGEFDVVHVRVLKDKHLKFVLEKPSRKDAIDAIAFFVDEPHNWLGSNRIKVAYRLSVNEFRDSRTVQMMVDQLERLD